MRWTALLGCLAAPLLGAGDAVFEKQVLDDNVGIGYGLAIGDVDGDKKPDVLLVDKTQVVWYRNGDWQRIVFCENLTKADNVCIAAQDLDGDGRVEVAVGANWNPGNTVDSGSVHYLIPPADRTQKWEPVALPCEPTVHRMHWLVRPNETPRLLVLPLHGKNNKAGAGDPVNLLVYTPPAWPLTPDAARQPWKMEPLSTGFNVTHNFDLGSGGRPADATPPAELTVVLGGKQGISEFNAAPGANSFRPLLAAASFKGPFKGVGEIRHLARREGPSGGTFLATIEPFHGNELAVYRLAGEQSERVLLDDTLKDGHAIAIGKLVPGELPQIVAGWRQPNGAQKVGINIYYAEDASGLKWRKTELDPNGVAVEDLKLADLNGDGKPDLIAAGRATKNLVIYWNKTP